MTEPARSLPRRSTDYLQGASSALSIALVALTASISYPAVVFSGPLLPHLPHAMATGLLASAVLGLTVAALSAYRGSVAYAQSAPSVMVALLAATLGQQFLVTNPQGPLLETALAMVAACAVVCGIALLLLGSFRLGNLIRYVPVPVIAGFLAGTGWTLMKSAVATTSGLTVSLANLPTLLAPERVAQWSIGLLGGMLLWSLARWRPRQYNVVMVLVGLVAAFWIMASWLGLEASTLRAQGWLFHVQADNWSPAAYARALQAADWWFILQAWPQFLALAAVTAISALIAISAVELSTDQDLNVNRELRITGLGNLLSGFVGGLPGHTSEASSGLAHRMGIGSRMVGVTVAACSLAVLLFAAPLINLVPKMVSGAMVAWIGLGLLSTWLYERGRQMSATDLAVTWTVLLSAIFLGITEAVAAGTATGVALFVLRYSRIPVARSVLSGAVAHSSVGRSPAHSAVLSREGEAIHILKLHGFVFFGTAHGLVSLVNTRLAQTGTPALRYLLVDLRLVSGIDSSAAAGFAKLERKARQQGFRLAISHASGDVDAVLASAFPIRGGESAVRRFPDLDRALEWAEDELLAQNGAVRGGEGEGFEALAERIFGPAHAAQVLTWFETVDVQPGDMLARMGDQSTEMFFIERGRIEVLLQRPGTGDIRLGVMEPGALIGEMAAYLGTPRTASLVAAVPTRVRRLAFERLQRLQESHPVQVAALHRHVAGALAGKLVDLHRLVRALDA